MKTKSTTPNLPVRTTGKQLPVRWDEEMARYAQRGTKMEASVAQGQFLSTRGGVLQYNGAPVAGNKLEVVVLDAIMENAYYEGKFDPDQPRAPVCFAFGREDDEMAPHEKSVKPQHAQCKGCPRNDFGTAAGTGRGKACKNVRRLALITGDAAQDPKTVGDAEVAFLKLPVTSIKPWAAYVRGLDAGLNRPTWGVISELSVVPDPKSQFKVLFTQRGVLNPKQLAGVFEKVKAVEPEIAFPYVYTEPEKQQTTRRATTKKTPKKY